MPEHTHMLSYTMPSSVQREEAQKRSEKNHLIYLIPHVTIQHAISRVDWRRKFPVSTPLRGGRGQSPQ